MEEIADSPALKLAQDLAGNTVRSRVAYAAEAGQFQEAGFPTVICGPGSIDQAHQPNEFISIDQMEQGERILEEIDPASVLSTQTNCAKKILSNPLVNS